MIKTKINKVDFDWLDIKNKCRTTVNKGESTVEATDKFKWRLLISEHSPIRLGRVNWKWEGLKSWVATHYVRHHNGVEKWVSTQRTDRTGTNRDELPQGAEVVLEMEANAQAVINMAKVRLCYQASPETRVQMEDLKRTLHEQEDTKQLSDAMIPSCVYRCGCPEFKECGFWTKFTNENRAGQLINIDSRYELYNKQFHQTKGVE